MYLTIDNSVTLEIKFLPVSDDEHDWYNGEQRERWKKSHNHCIVNSSKDMKPL